MRQTGDSRIDGSLASTVVGSDEVGFGAWAGPLVVAAVAVPRDWEDSRVKDSKKLTEKRREALYAEYYKPDGFPMHIEIIEASVIDEQGVWPCLRRAHVAAIQGVLGRVSSTPLIIVDGNVPVEGGISLPKADNLIPAVALASVIAKVTRDRIMVQLDEQYPGYDFAKSKGYGVPKHQAALNDLGPCQVHRRFYEPVARAYAQKAQENEGWVLDDF